MGKDAVQYTLPKDNAYRIIIENAMQGPLCFKSFEAVLGDYKIGRTYNIYTLPDTAYSMDKEIQFTIKIPSDIYKKDREYQIGQISIIGCFFVGSISIKWANFRDVNFFICVHEKTVRK